MFSFSHSFFWILVRKDVKKSIKSNVNENNIEISDKKYTRQGVESDSDTMYLFTDNAERTSAPNSTSENVDKNSWYYKKYKSQTNKPIHFGTLNNPTSAVIRGLNNAYPISTMSAYGINWSDDNFKLFKIIIDDEINQIKKDLVKFSKLKIGNYRIGQGGLKAKLPQQHQNYLDNKLKELGIDNTQTNPKLFIEGNVQIVSTRIKNSNEHFGNPFSHDPEGKAHGLIKTETVKEAVERYIDWVINSKEDRPEWIREQLKSGELKGKPVLYYKELGEPSHATALDYLINKYDWGNITSSDDIVIENLLPLGYVTREDIEEIKRFCK